MYLSGHPMSGYGDVAKAAGCVPLIDIVSGKVPDGSRVRVMGIIDGARVRQLKGGSMLASTVLEDTTAFADITVFSAAYEMYKQYLTAGAIVLITGKVSEREDRNTEIICSAVKPVDEEFLSEIKKPKRLKIRVSGIKSPDFLAAQKIMERYGGNTQVLIFCRDTGKCLLAPERLFVKEDAGLIEELKTLLGEKNVKFE